MRGNEYEKPVPVNSRETADELLERCVAQAKVLEEFAKGLRCAGQGGLN